MDETRSVAAAAESGDVAQLGALLAAGGDPNEPETDEHDPPLLEAARTGHDECVRLLLDAGAELYQTNSGGETPLGMAAQCGSLAVCRLLADRGYRMDGERDNAAWMLTDAARQGFTETVLWLLAQGVAVDTNDNRGRTALTNAATHNHLELVVELLRAGADPNHRDNDTETVLMWAADHPGNAGVLRALVQGGADVNAVNDFGGTALNWVTRHGDPAMVKVLLEAGTKVNLSGALNRAAYNGMLPAVRLLLEHGVEWDSSDSDRAATLAHASNRGYREVVNLLRQSDADRRLRATGESYPPRAFAVGTPVRTLTGTPRTGWIVLVEWHHIRGEWGYFIEVEAKTRARKNESRRYRADELAVIEEARPANT